MEIGWYPTQVISEKGTLLFAKNISVSFVTPWFENYINKQVTIYSLFYTYICTISFIRITRRTCRLFCKKNWTKIINHYIKLFVHWLHVKMLTYRSSGVRARYSRSINPSIRFLIITGEGKNRARSCSVTSVTRILC